MEGQGGSVNNFWTEISGETTKPELLAWRGEALPDVGEMRSIFYQGMWWSVYVSGWTAVLDGYDRVYLCYRWPPMPKPVTF